MAMNPKIKGAELPEKEKWNRTFLQICTFVQNFTGVNKQF